MIDYLRGTLLSNPEKDHLYQFEQNRLRFNGVNLDQDSTQNSEKIMLTGFFLVVKMLIVKMFMSPHKYNLGVNLSE